MTGAKAVAVRIAHMPFEQRAITFDNSGARSVLVSERIADATLPTAAAIAGTDP